MLIKKNKITVTGTQTGKDTNTIPQNANLTSLLSPTHQSPTHQEPVRKKTPSSAPPSATIQLPPTKEQPVEREMEDSSKNSPIAYANNIEVSNIGEYKDKQMLPLNKNGDNLEELSLVESGQLWLPDKNVTQTALITENGCVKNFIGFVKMTVGRWDAKTSTAYSVDSTYLSLIISKKSFSKDELLRVDNLDYNKIKNYIAIPLIKLKTNLKFLVISAQNGLWGEVNTQPLTTKMRSLSNDGGILQIGNIRIRINAKLEHKSIFGREIHNKTEDWEWYIVAGNTDDEKVPLYAIVVDKNSGRIIMSQQIKNLAISFTGDVPIIYYNQNGEWKKIEKGELEIDINCIERDLWRDTKNAKAFLNKNILTNKG